MIFCVLIFIFCLKPTLREQVGVNNFRHCYGNFVFESTVLKLLITAIFKVLSQQLRGTLTNRILKKPYNWKFYGHGSSKVAIFSWLNIFKWRTTKVPGKLPFTQESEPASQRTLLQDISLIIACSKTFHILLHAPRHFTYYSTKLMQYVYITSLFRKWNLQEI